MLSEFLNEYSNSKAQEMLATWKDLAVRLIVRYNDMAVKKMENGMYVKTKNGLAAPVTRPGYPKEYAKRMISLGGKDMKMPK